MGDTIVFIQRDQVLHNIGAAISDRSSVPSGIVLGTGQANVSLGLAPSMKTTALNMSKPSIELDISPTDTWTSQWQFTSITNQDDLRRLRNLYALIVATDQQYDALELYYREHPHLAAVAAPEPSRSHAVFRNLFEGLLPSEPAPPPPSPPAVSPQKKATKPPAPNPPSPPPAMETPANQQIVPWQAARRYIVDGDSIDCKLYQSMKQDRPSGVPYKRWLFWRGADGQWLPEPPDPTQPMHDLGRHGQWDIGVTSIPCFDDFVILVQGFTPVTNQASTQGPKLMLTTP